MIYIFTDNCILCSLVLFCYAGEKWPAFTSKSVSARFIGPFGARFSTIYCVRRAQYRKYFLTLVHMCALNYDHIVTDGIDFFFYYFRYAGLITTVYVFSERLYFIKSCRGGDQSARGYLTLQYTRTIYVHPKKKNLRSRTRHINYLRNSHK